MVELPHATALRDRHQLTEYLAQELAARAAQLPLEGLLQSGGWPDLATLMLAIPALALDGDLARGELQCTFHEVIANGCGVVRDEITGTLPFTLDLRSGRLGFDPPA